MFFVASASFWRQVFDRELAAICCLRQGTSGETVKNNKQPCLCSSPRVQAYNEPQSLRGAPPLAIAVAAQHISLVEELLRARADVDALSERGQTPLMLAAAAGHQEMWRSCSVRRGVETVKVAAGG